MLPEAIDRRGLRYLAVGASGVPVDLAVTTLAAAVVGVLPAQAVGWGCAATWNWNLNSRVTWDGQQTIREWAQYLAVDAGRLALRVGVVAVLLEYVRPVMATAGGIAVAATVGFLGLDRLVFGSQ